MGTCYSECDISLQRIQGDSSKGPGILIREDDSIPEATTCLEGRTSYRWRSLGQRIFLEWKWEIGSLLVSILTLMAIIVTLSKQDGKVILSLPSRINLNSIIAILTTILRVTLLVVVGEGKIVKGYENRMILSSTYY